MIILDQPYVSEFLYRTILENDLPVLANSFLHQHPSYSSFKYISEKDAIERLKAESSPLLYTASENSLNWVSKYLNTHPLHHSISIFKDKFQFRKSIHSLYPNFFFKEIPLTELETLDVNCLPMPFIIKPSTGFFSLGVYHITNKEQWQSFLKSIKIDLQEKSKLYPSNVLDTNTFIIEEVIPGKEFAIDAYFNHSGEAVILNIFHHPFSSEQNVQDRLYYCSKEIIEKYLTPFTDYLNQMGSITKLKNFPLHVEVRCDELGKITPIEVNPLRFGGWCTTADATYHAYGQNSYLTLINQAKPNWNQLLKNKENKKYCIIVLNNSSGIKEEQLLSFDYAKLTSNFKNVLELRKVNFRQHPLFGFLFIETSSADHSYLEKILNSDLKEFISTQSPEFFFISYTNDIHHPFETNGV